MFFREYTFLGHFVHGRAHAVQKRWANWALEATSEWGGVRGAATVRIFPLQLWALGSQVMREGFWIASVLPQRPSAATLKKISVDMFKLRCFAHLSARGPRAP